MADPYDYIIGAKKRVWLALQGNPRYGSLLVERALERALRGVDVRIVTEHVSGLYEVVGHFVYAKRVFVENLSVAEAQVADDICIIDDKAWIRINGILTEVDVKEAERKFEELWKKDERKFKGILNKRTGVLISWAKKRALATIPQIDRDDVRALIEKASDGVDVYVITNDKSIVASTMERLMRDSDRRLVRAGKLEMLKAAIGFLMFAIFVGLPILFYSLFPFPKSLLLSLLVEFALPFVSIFFLTFDDYVTKEVEGAEKAVKMVRDASKHLNVLSAPVAEEFYIVDDRAWAAHDDGDKVVEIDAWDAERKFVELWKLYEGPWVLGKDVK